MFGRVSLISCEHLNHSKGDNKTFYQLFLDFGKLQNTMKFCEKYPNGLVKTNSLESMVFKEYLLFIVSI